MPSSPATPSRARRRSSGLSGYQARNTSQTSLASPSGRPHSRRSSNTSLFSNSTPRPTSAHGSGILPDLGSSLHAENGLGSLADELAEEEWDEELYEEGGLPQLDGPASPPVSPAHKNRRPANILSPPFVPEVSSSGISKALEERIAGIEALARQEVGSSDNEVFTRVSEQLRELSSQANVETGITRLATAHNALSSNLGNQSRVLTALTQHLFSPLAPAPPPAVSDEIAEHVHALLLALPQTTIPAHAAAHELHDLGAELALSLGHLGDTLQMARQTTNHAARWLRSAVEAATTLRRELDDAEHGRLWLERHQCAERLRKREAAQSCRDVVKGFEEVCDSWRARLVQAAQVEVAS